MHYKFLIQTKQDNPGGNFVEMSNLFVCDFFFFNKKRLLYHAKII